MAEDQLESAEVSDAINAITRANLGSAVRDRQQWRDLVNDYFLFDEEDASSDDDNVSEEEEDLPEDRERVEQSDEVEDPPLVEPDPTEQVLDAEKQKCVVLSFI